jgi:hypothetical protein
LSRTGITSKDVFKAAETLIAQDQTPTQESIREYLGRGSRGTIHKYLKQWKKNCFQKGGAYSNMETIDIKTVLEEKRALEKVIEKQITQNELLATQLVDAERSLMQTQEKNQQLIIALEKFKEQHTPLEMAHKSLQEAYQVLREGQDKALQTLMIDKNQHIESLRQELKEVNQTSLASVMDIGYRGDDALMMEKVKTLHLKDQVIALEKTVETLKQQLSQTQPVNKISYKTFEEKQISHEKKVLSEPG